MYNGVKVNRELYHWWVKIASRKQIFCSVWTGVTLILDGHSMSFNFMKF